MMIIIIIIIMMMISAYVGRLFSLLLLVLLIIASAYENDCDYWLYHRFARRPWRIACFVVEWNLWTEALAVNSSYFPSRERNVSNKTLLSIAA